MDNMPQFWFDRIWQYTTFTVSSLFRHFDNIQTCTKKQIQKAQAIIP